MNKNSGWKDAWAVIVLAWSIWTLYVFYCIANHVDAWPFSG